MTNFKVTIIKRKIRSPRELYSRYEILNPEFDGQQDAEYREKSFVRYKDAYMFYINQCSLYLKKAAYKDGIQTLTEVYFDVVYSDNTSEDIFGWNNLDKMEVFGG